jgi:hypothetical protein
MMKGVLTGVGIALLGLLASTAAQAASFQNGSFEDPGLFTPDVNQTYVVNVGDSFSMPHWNVAGHEIAWIHNGNPFGLAASDGDFFLDLTSYGSGPGGIVEQSFDTIVGGIYNVTFDIGGGTGVQVEATAAGSSNVFTGVAVGLTSWESQVLSFVATGTTTLLSFKGITQVAGNYIGLDNVKVAFSGVTTPIPASVLLFVTALLGLGFAGWRRKQGAA